MCSKDKIVYCPHCDMFTPCIVSGTGRKYICQECEGEFEETDIPIYETDKQRI